jgi:hypothetical protein
VLADILGEAMATASKGLRTDLKPSLLEGSHFQ